MATPTPTVPADRGAPQVDPVPGIVGPGPRSRSAPRSSRRVRAVATLTAAGGVLAVLASLRPYAFGLGSLNRVVDPLIPPVGAHVLAVSIGLALLYLAGNLRRRKHMAWMITTALFAVHLFVQVSHLVDGGRGNVRGTPAQLAFTAMMVVLLLASRSEFTAMSDPPSLFSLVRFIAVYVVVVIGYGFLALALERDHLDPAWSVGRSTVTVARSLVGLDGVYAYERLRFAEVYPRSMLLLGMVGFAVAAFLLLRPIVARPRTHDDWDRARHLVQEHGSTSLAYFALRHDKSYFFSSDGRAMIAYTYIGRYALASGDPIGHPDSIDLVVDEFLSMCRDHGWGFAFLAVREADVKRFLDRRLRSFYLGDEAVIDCSTFTLMGKRNKSMRQSVQRVARTHRFEMLREPDASPWLIDQLNQISSRWRGKAPERGFTMSLSQDVEGLESDYRLCVAFDEHGVPKGFLRIVPIFGVDPGCTLDLMRRDPDAPNGMTEFLVTNTVAALHEEGLRRFSMNFAVMGRLFAEDLATNRRQRLARRAVSALNPFFQIESLHAFNRRFRPEWEPRLIVYEDQRCLPRVALLYGGVEGFLSLPLIGRYLVPRRFDPARPETETDRRSSIAPTRS